MIRSFTCALFLLLTASLCAQDLSLDEKYAALRDRFDQDFVHIHWEGNGLGTFNEENEVYSEAGYSLPCSGVFPIDNPYAYWEFSHSNCQDNKTISSTPHVKKWGDGTLHLGYYWSVLATEYAWLVKQGRMEEAHKTTHELYLALQAYRRLDLTGQQYARIWNQSDDNCEVQLPYTGYSGFFLRDDVPAQFKDVAGVGGIVSSRACREKATDFFKSQGKGNVISQDQNAVLLMGLAFINKVYPDTTFQLNGSAINIKSIARKIGFGIVNHVHESRMRNFKFSPCKGGKVQTGGNSIVYAFAMRRALDFLAPNHRIRSSFWDRVSWELFAEDIGVIFGRAIGLAKNDNVGMYLTYCVSADMESMSDVIKVSSSASQKEIFPFAKAFVHDYNVKEIPQFFVNRLEALLQSCPMVGTGVDAEGLSEEWKYDNRWRTYSAKPGFKGRGNGLDFLLACNLYRLLYGEGEIEVKD